MAVTYSTSAKTARMQAVADKIDGASGAGKLQIGTSGMASILATVPLAFPCGTVSGAVLTFNMPQTDAACDNTGVAASARILDADDNVIVSGLTVGLSSSDIIVSSVNLISGSPFTINSGTITHAA